MDTDTGRFVDSPFAPKKANRYEVGQMVSLDGDDYEVVDIRNVSGRGQIMLRAMSRFDHEQRLAEHRGINPDPVNRAARRLEDRKERLERKRRRHPR